jgi:adenine deaminase
MLFRNFLDPGPKICYEIRRERYDMRSSLAERIGVASGRGQADLLIRNGRVVDVFSGQIEKKDVAVYDGTIVGFGDYRARKTLDLKGQFLCPGLIDGHVHVESSMVTLPEFARAILPHGTTSVVIDPHEIANVLGSRGVRFMAESARHSHLNVFIMVPSCVPATHLETSGAALEARDIQALLKEPWAIGLAEMMNFPGVIHGDPGVIRKIEIARGKRVDGHAPFLSGKDLHAYSVAGIRSDHECTTSAEAKEKLKNGLWIMVREGTAARNLEDLLPLVTHANSRRFFFVTDDRHPRELLYEGHIDSMVRKAIRLGLDPLLAIQMATLNAADYFRLDDLGAIAPGFRADFVVFDNLSRFQIRKVFKDGVLVAEDGRMVIPSRPLPISRKSLGTLKSVRLKALKKEDLSLRAAHPLAKVIQLVPNQILTRKVMRRVLVKDGVAHPNPTEDVLKAVVVERHHATGNVGIGWVQGFGLKRGAIGSSVAHDSHNIVVVGTNDPDILKSVQAIQAMGGGLVTVADEGILASVPLPVAGLMSERPVSKVQEQMETLEQATQSLGCKLPDPFMALSFLSLPVIPELKLTDRGLVDVTRFKIVSVFGND